MSNNQRDFVEVLTGGLIAGIAIGSLIGAARLLIYVIIAA